MYYFSENLGYKLVENYDGFEKSSLFFSKNRKTVKKKFGNRHASKQTPFSYSIFHRYLQNMHQKIRKGPYFMNSSSSGEFEVLCLCLL